MINQIEKTYQHGVAESIEREVLFTRSLQMWLRPFAEEINRQNGKLVLIFCQDGMNRFKLEGVDEALREKVEAQFPKFISGK